MLEKHKEDWRERFACRQWPDTSNVMKPKRRTFFCGTFMACVSKKTMNWEPIGIYLKKVGMKNTPVHMASTSTVP